MISHLRYLRYVLRHKWFVFVAGFRIGVPLWRLLIHDWAKFTPAEWRPYVRYFYGAPPASASQWTTTAGTGVDLWHRRVEYEFELAWLHHQHASPHHWQHWVLEEDDGETKLLPMPEHFIREMVADWAGAGRAKTGRWEVREWYAENGPKMLLHPDTRRRVDELVGPDATT